MTISAEEKTRRMRFAREEAASCWCGPTTSHIPMDVVLAEAFAVKLVAQMYAPHLGCATTGELLEELKARSDLSYKTLADGEPPCTCSNGHGTCEACDRP